jgi:hypothetical protein
MNVEKFFEMLGILYAEKNNIKIKSFKLKRIDKKV